MALCPANTPIFGDYFFNGKDVVASRQYLHLILAIVLLGCSREDTKDTSQTQNVTQIPVGNPEQGKALFATCAACHGKAGQGNHEFQAPALANSERWYLHRQLTNFHKGIRGYLPADTLGFQMAAMAKTLKDSIAIGNVIAYIKTFPPVVLPALIKGDIKKGERTYQSVCGSCHGSGAKGNEKMNAPRLNGLDDWYLKTQISKFKNSIRGAHPDDKLGAQMTPMVSLLTNDQAIDDVIAYIRSTIPPPVK